MPRPSRPHARARHDTRAQAHECAIFLRSGAPVIPSGRLGGGRGISQARTSSLRSHTARTHAVLVRGMSRPSRPHARTRHDTRAQAHECAIFLRSGAPVIPSGRLGGGRGISQARTSSLRSHRRELTAVLVREMSRPSRPHPRARHDRRRLFARRKKRPALRRAFAASLF